MEFRIVTTDNPKFFNNLPGTHYEIPVSRIHKPSELTLDEKVELIKQLCPEINKIALKWWENTPKMKQAALENKFLDYLRGEMK